jgi:hypothetical protein
MKLNYSIFISVIYALPVLQDKNGFHYVQVEGAVPD